MTLLESSVNVKIYLIGTPVNMVAVNSCNSPREFTSMAYYHSSCELTETIIALFIKIKMYGVGWGGVGCWS